MTLSTAHGMRIAVASVDIWAPLHGIAVANLGTLP